MHVKNIRNMEFNSYIFKIHKKRKKEIYEKFEEKLCSSGGAHGPSKILKLFYFMYSY